METSTLNILIICGTVLILSIIGMIPKLRQPRNLTEMMFGKSNPKKEAQKAIDDLLGK